MALSIPTPAPVVKKEEGEEENEYGVLLYYKYAEIPDLQSLLSFYDSNCNSLSLLGRVRLSSHGVNVTVGGKLWALKKHIESVKSIPLFHGTDFKLASSHFPFSNDKVARECGFTSLSIRIVKELVTLCPNPQLNPPDISNVGRHLSADEFHSLLHNAEHVADEKSSKGLVLLDARNLYETRIGKFRTPAVKTLDPGIRQYSDLPSWIDDNSEQLRDKNVLMYCTGGIRCEMASAYIRSKGAGFENVFQLFGGIQRYLEQFPDGGFFKGKNFVFDHRISVGSSDRDILGTCLLCSLSFDDYSARCRCAYCRMLVLVCDKCQTEEAVYVCELCQQHGRSVGSVPLIGTGKTEEATAPEIRLQTTDPDAVPELQRGQGKVRICITCPVDFTLATYLFGDRDNGAGTPRKLRILCLHGFRQNASSFKGRTASLAKKLKHIVELIFVDAPHELPFIYQPRVTELEQSNESSFPLQQTLPPIENCRKKFAWLMAPDSKGRGETDWKMADIPFDALQHQHQIEGFDASLEYLKAVFSQKGPFDGMLGFSQGAAMAALVCMQKLRLGGEIDFRFVILCSGFALQLREIQRGTINCPSLHIFGSVSGSDRQIANQESKNLASMFDEGCSVIIEHDCGHIIPTRPPYIDEIKSFLQRFL